MAPQTLWRHCTKGWERGKGWGGEVPFALNAISHPLSYPQKYPIVVRLNVFLALLLSILRKQLNRVKRRGRRKEKRNLEKERIWTEVGKSKKNIQTQRRRVWKGATNVSGTRVLLTPGSLNRSVLGKKKKSYTPFEVFLINKPFLYLAGLKPVFTIVSSNTTPLQWKLENWERRRDALSWFKVTV